MKILRKTILVALFMAILFGLSGCNEEKKAESAVNSVVSALQQGDFEKAALNIEGEDVFNEESLEAISNGKELVSAMFSKLSCNINSSEKIDSNTVKVNVDITTADMKTAFTNSVSELFKSAFSNALASDEEKMTNEDMESKLVQLLMDSINDENAETVSNTVDINVVKADGVWKLDVDETVADAFTGGLLSASESLGGALGN